MEDNPKFNECPEFPFFGAQYPDATCRDGQLYDLDRCDDQGNLYEMHEYWPCPFCNTKRFVKEYAEYRDWKQKDVRKLVDDLKVKYNYKPQSHGSDKKEG